MVCPGVEAAITILIQHFRLEVSLHGVELAHGIGDRGSRCHDDGAAWVLPAQVLNLHHQIHGALRPRGVNALDVGSVGGEVQLAELVPLVHIQSVDTKLLERQNPVLGAFGNGLEAILELLDAALDLLDGYAVLLVGLVKRGSPVGDLSIKKRLCKLVAHPDKTKGGMGDYDGIRVIQRSLGHKLATVVGVEVLLVGHHDRGGRVELQELLGELGQHVVRNHIHRLFNQP